MSDRPSYISVSRSALRDNFRSIAKHVGGAEVIPVLKGNAYGHGLIECVREFEAAGAKRVGVAIVEEAIALRQAGISIDILVFGGMPAEQADLFLEHDLECTVSSTMKLERINEMARTMGKRAKIQLKIDTGFERIGIHYYSATPLLEGVLKAESCDVVGIYSHLACAEDNPETTRLQLERFLEVCSFFEQRSLPMPLRHIANSAAVLNFPASWLDAVRPGIIVYGVLPDRSLGGIIPLRPALSLRSTVVYFKVVKAGASVSYGHTWTAPHNCRVVTIPVGYADGYPRRLSNIGSVLIRGKRYPIIGRVNMDQFMVNIEQGTAYNGDEVMLIGTQEGETITAEEVAEQIGSIPHEVVTCLSNRLSRVYVE